MDNMSRIRGVSRRFRYLFILLMIITPIVPVIIWMSYNNLSLGVRDQLYRNLYVTPIPSMSLSTRLLACLASLIPSVIAAIGFFHLNRLFGLYEQGRIFLRENVRYYRRLGYIIIFAMVGSRIYTTLASTIVTLNLPPGQRTLSVVFSSDDVAQLVIGMMVIVVSWIMDIGRELHEEQQLTV